MITEQTKIRLKELEQELLQIDFDIDREKQRTYTFLTINDIKQFLKSKVFTDTSSIKVRKLIVNTFIREIIYYPDKLIITYNFSDAIDTINLTPENAKEIERQSKSAFSLDIGSSICQHSSPNKNAEKDTRNCASSAFLLLFRGILPFQSIKNLFCDNKSLYFGGVCAFGEWAILAFVKIVGFIKIMAIIKI